VGQVPLDGFADIRRLGAPTPSPDGAYVVFPVTHVDAAQNRYRSELWLYARASGQARPLTFGPSDTSAAWSPDGTAIAFLATRGTDDEPQLYLLPIGGGEARRLSTGLRGAAQVAFRPDGQAISVLAWKDEPEDDTAYLWRAVEEAGALPGSGPRTGDVRISARVKYRVDGVGYADDRRRHVAQVVVGDDPAEAAWLTHGAYDVSHYAWHPDGTRLAFVRSQSGRVDETHDTALYEAVPAQGAPPRQLAHPGGRIAGFAWSPDGGRIALVADDGSLGLATDPQLWLCDAGTGGLTRLAADIDRPFGPHLFGDSSPFSPGAGVAWDPDGKGLAVQIGDAGSVVPMHLHLADGRLTRLVGNSFRGNCASLVRAPDAYWLSIDSSDRPAELYELALAGGEPVRRTDVNTTRLGAWHAKPYEAMRYESADGTPVEAFVLRPAGFVEGRRYPLVLIIHGGPQGMFGHAFEHEAQRHAAEGRLVLMVNPRGSRGYGQRFAAAGKNDWGGGDFQDIMAGVDELVRRGWADPARMAVNGVSYGGYMTCWTITHTDRFACAIPEMLSSNRVSMAGTSDIGWYMGRDQLGGTPAAGADRLWEHSPLAHVERASTPTLLISGESDYRCPIGQAEELYTALCWQGVEAVLVRLQGASHTAAWTGAPRLRLARKSLIEAFLARHGVAVAP